MEKRIITFKASGQSLQRVGGITTAASDTVNYFEAHFELDENWQSLDSVRAIWSNEDTAVPSLLVNGICEIPSEVLTNVSKLKVNLVGSIADNGVVTDRLTTFTCPAFGITVKVPIDGTEPQEVTPTQFEQFVEAVKADADRAEQAVDDAEGQADRSKDEADRAEAEADNALASAQNAHASELRASGYASDAQQSAESAQGYAQNASESAISAENAKDDAEDARDVILGMRAVATILPEGSEPTARFENGVLYLGIPKGDTGEKGDKGNTGDAAGFGTVTATIDANVGTPSVEVTVSGADTAKNFSFAFHNMKGNTGDTGNGIASIALKSTSGSVKTYRITMTNGSTFDFDVTDGEVTNDALAEILEEFAKKIGYYEDLSAGTADQLTTDKCDEDSELYILRKTGNGAEVHDKEYLDKIVGGTIAWNQLLTNTQPTRTINGITFTNNGDGTYTVNGTATADATFSLSGGSGKPAHKALLCGCPMGGSPSSYILWDGYAGWFDSGNGTVKPFANSGNWGILITVKSGITVNNIVFKPQLFDLTQMFGSTIADYIYSLEQATAGAGVAWFRNLFPNEYYEYDSGSLKSVEGLQSHNTTGKNLMPMKLYRGISYNPAVGDTPAITDSDIDLVDNGDGTFSATFNSSWTSRDFIAPIKKGVAYHLKFKTQSGGTQNGLTYGYLDENGKVLYKYNTTDNPATYNFTLIQDNYLTSDEGYIYLALSNRAGANALMKITEPQLELGANATDYEPYIKHSYPLDNSLTLRGIPKLADGKLYYDGDTYEADGTVTRKYGIVDLGSLSWTYRTTQRMFTASLSNYKKPTGGYVVPNAISSAYRVTTISNVVDSSSGYDKVMTLGMPANWDGLVIVRDSSFADAPSFKTAMSGVMLVYELATPTVEEAQPYQPIQFAEANGTEEFVSNESVKLPVGHYTRYPIDLRSKLEYLPSLVEEDGNYAVHQEDGQMSLEKMKTSDLVNDGVYSTLEQIKELLPTDTASGSIASFPDGQSVIPALSVLCDIDPIQDLHGYDKPWSGGAGKNKFDDSSWSFIRTNRVTWGTSIAPLISLLNSLAEGTYTIISKIKIDSLNESANNRTYGFLFGGENFSIDAREAKTKPTVGSVVTTSKTFSITSSMVGTFNFAYAYAGGGTMSDESTFQYICLNEGNDSSYYPYSNICPISGHTECVTDVSGFNVWDEEIESGGIYNDTGTEFASDSFYRCKGYIPIKPNTNYYFKCSDHAISANKTTRVIFYDSDKAVISSPSGSAQSRAITSPNNAHYMRFFTNESVNNFDNTASINYPSTDHDYHAYNGTTHTTSLGRTVYGGTLDVVSGVLTVTHANIASYAGETLPSTWICDRAVYAEGVTPPTGSQIVYELATPQTYQLTPTEIALLKGQNNVWCDTGEVEVTYKADVGLYIDKKLS